jgi:hypothetical protein
VTTLPGTIPNLLRRGSPVVYTLDGSNARGILTGYVTGSDACPLDVSWDGGVISRRCPHAEVALDLTDEAGMDRAARWLAEAVGLDASNGVTWAPGEDESCPTFPRGVWCLEVIGRQWRREWVKFAAPSVAHRLSGRVIAVDGFEGRITVNPVDRAAALRLAVLHVAGGAP